MTHSSLAEDLELSVQTLSGTPQKEQTTSDWQGIEILQIYPTCHLEG